MKTERLDWKKASRHSKSFMAVLGIPDGTIVPPRTMSGPGPMKIAKKTKKQKRRKEFRHQINLEIARIVAMQAIPPGVRGHMALWNYGPFRRPSPLPEGWEKIYTGARKRLRAKMAKGKINEQTQ